MGARGDIFRLQENVHPTEYRIEFQPDLKKPAFSGRETIKMEVEGKADRIILNSHELEIRSFAVSQGTAIKSEMKIDKKNQRLEFVLEKELKSGKAEIELEFEGILNDDLRGFYRSKYKSGGKEKCMALTQFEAPYARMAFPCFDQPDKKAAFDITLVIDKELQGLSNMPVESERAEGGKKVLKFGRTPVMSTYLLFVAVGEFEFLDGVHEGKSIRVVSVPGKKKEGAMALDLTIKFLDYFEKYTGIPYPLPKLDMIAIPDFAAGAMENWGAITFRELLLLSDDNTSISRKRRVAEVIAHELWHQWSGNLVTMKWWNDLWLNESFADYMAYKAVDHYFPEWNIMEDFVLSETEAAFRLDSLETTHPIEVVVNSPNEIEEIFDGISYSKGGNVLRMIEGFMGDEAFRKGVSKYLSKFSYKNAESRDLWDILSEFSDSDIRKVIESWIRQPGFPIIEARRSGSSLVLSQKRFSRAKHDQVWKIPLLIQTENGLKKELFEKKEMCVPLEPGWFKLNQDQMGFYRVKYEESELELLGRDIQSKKMPPMDRWGIQNDLFNLCWIGEVGIDSYLKFMGNYRNEDNYTVLLDIFINLKSVYNMLSTEPGFEKVWPEFRNLMKEPFERAFRRLTWEPKGGEPHEDTLLRALSVGYLGFAKDGKVLKACLEKFRGMSKGNARVPPDLRGTVCALVAENFPENFDAMIKLYETTKNLEDKMRFLMSLYRFRDERKLRLALDFALSGKVRMQDLRGVFSTVSINTSYRKAFFPWARKNWKVVGEYQKTHYVFMGLLDAMIGLCTGTGNGDAVRSFLKSKKVGYGRTKKNLFEALIINNKFISKNKPILKSFFQSTDKQAH